MGVLTAAATRTNRESVIVPVKKQDISLKAQNAQPIVALKSKELYEPRVTLDNINPAIVKMDYVVRGEVLMRAGAIQKELDQV